MNKDLRLPSKSALDEPADICLVSSDQRFGIFLPRSCLRTLLSHAARDYPSETGGILLGKYKDSLDLAIVTEVSGPPKDSQKARSGFWRGILGLQSIINRLWKEKQYYLGEWHVHPDGPPIPSTTDYEQMRAIAASPGYHCPEPLLLILGFSRQPSSSAWSVGAYVFPRGGGMVALSIQDAPEGIRA